MIGLGLENVNNAQVDEVPDVEGAAVGGDDDEEEAEEGEEKEAFVNAPAHVAKADVAHAVQNPENENVYPTCYFAPRVCLWNRNIKYIPDSQEFEFVSN